MRARRLAGQEEAMQKFRLRIIGLVILLAGCAGTVTNPAISAAGKAGAAQPQPAAPDPFADVGKGGGDGGGGY